MSKETKGLVCFSRNLVNFTASRMTTQSLAPKSAKRTDGRLLQLNAVRKWRLMKSLFINKSQATEGKIRLYKVDSIALMTTVN